MVIRKWQKDFLGSPVVRNPPARCGWGFVLWWESKIQATKPACSGVHKPQRKKIPRATVRTDAAKYINKQE